ncbi:hypothetical protein GCM10010271_68160 [Streptomyces kurssanovii]|nr:hypothetical protein GCM10010271_68160 [Streptomyces kurssanovii]
MCSVTHARSTLFDGTGRGTAGRTTAAGPDDEGLYNHPVNKLATVLAVRFGFTYQDYHGPVLLTGGADAEGDTVPLSKDKLLALLTSLEEEL